jgi:hypothetical protein
MGRVTGGVRSGLENVGFSSSLSNDRYVVPWSLARPPTPTIDGVISIQYEPRVPPGNAGQHGGRLGRLANFKTTGKAQRRGTRTLPYK